MDELTYEEKLKLVDSREHLQVVLGNIRTANSELMKLLNLIEEATIKIAELNNEKKSLFNEIEKHTILHKERNRIITDKESDLSKRKGKLDEYEKIVNNSISKSQKNLEDIDRKISTNKLEYETKKSNYEYKISDLNKKLDFIKELIKEDEEIIENQFRVKKTLENEIFSLTSEKSKAEKELEKFKEYSSAVMEEINKNILLEKEKVFGPLKLLKLESEKMEIQKEDLAIIKARLTEQYVKQNPDKNLPIELQTK